MAAIVGKKIGMTQVFTEDGTRVPVTVIEAGAEHRHRACAIPDRDGYAAVQVASARSPSASSPSPSSAI